jgi:hypothetical protein
LTAVPAASLTDRVTDGPSLTTITANHAAGLADGDSSVPA